MRPSVTLLGTAIPAVTTAAAGTTLPRPAVFFYLRAERARAKTINGIAHTSPTCNGSTITGIGRDAAQKIWYRAMTVNMTSSTHYKGARTAASNAARDLYGSGSTPYSTVAAAWSAVSVS